VKAFLPVFPAQDSRRNADRVVGFWRVDHGGHDVGFGRRAWALAQPAKSVNLFLRSGSAVSAADSVQPRARMRHSTGSPGMMHRVRASKSASVLSTQPDGSCAHGGKSMRPPWDIAVQRRWFRLQRKSYSAGSTLGEPFAALASSRPIMFARPSQPSAAVRSLLSWRGWRSASAIFCSARSRHSAAVSMAFLGGPRRGAFKQRAPNASVQNRTPPSFVFKRFQPFPETAEEYCRERCGRGDFLTGQRSCRDHGNSHRAAARPIKHFGTQLLHASLFNNGDAI